MHIKGFVYVLAVFMPLQIVAGPQENYVLPFLEAFNEGADCPRLFELRNQAKRRGARQDQVKMMGNKLRSVGCFSDTSKRRPDVPAGTGNLLLKNTGCTEK